MTSEERKDSAPDNGQKGTPKAPRRNFLKVGIVASMALVVAGIGGVAESLISPPAVKRTTTKSTTSSKSSSATSESSTSAASSTSQVTSGSATSASSSSASSSSTTTTSSISSPFPRVMVAKIGDLSSETPLSFNYPLDDKDVPSHRGWMGEGGCTPRSSTVAQESREQAGTPERTRKVDPLAEVSSRKGIAGCVEVRSNPALVRKATARRSVPPLLLGRIHLHGSTLRTGHSNRRLLTGNI